jgi:hypothetical protein
MTKSPVKQKIKRAIFLTRFTIPRARPTGAYISCRARPVGIGAQADSALSTILFAHDAGLHYVHHPFTRVRFGNGDADDDRWENFFNLGKGELSFDQVPADLDPPRMLLKLQDIRFLHKGSFYQTWHCREYTNTFPDRYLGIMDRIRANYYSTPKPVPHRDRGRLNIAVHVRRGDITPGHRRFTSNEVIAAMLSNVLSVTGPASVRLYSEGRPDDFGALPKMAEPHLNECPFETFHNLVSADVLIMARSCFSYMAALLSCGVKVYEPSLVAPLRQWVCANDDAKLRTQIFNRKSPESQ